MPGGYYYSLNCLEMAEHGSSHLDAPSHFARGGQTLDHLPIERLIGVVSVGVIAQCARDQDSLVTIRDFEKWEASYG